MCLKKIGHDVQEGLAYSTYITEKKKGCDIQKGLPYYTYKIENHKLTLQEK